MIESPRPSRAGADEVYVSPWKFYQSLEFLSDAFILQKTKSNANDEGDGAPMLTQNLLLVKHPRNLLWCKIMSFIQL